MQLHLNKQQQREVSNRTGGRHVAQLVEYTSMLLRQVRFPSAARDFSPRVKFQCRLSYMCLYTPMCIHMH